MKSISWISCLLLILLPCNAFATDEHTDQVETNAPVIHSLKPSALNPATSTSAPGTLTTLFAANNSYRGNMFDIEPWTDITEISGVDINVDPAAQSVEVDVYWREGTCVGHDMDPTGWYKLGSAYGTAAGLDLPTFIDLAGNGVSFSAGQVYGIYVDIANYPYCDINYTNGGPNSYGNDDLELTTYYGKGSPAFTGSTFNYRIWNGTVYYEAGPPSSLIVHPNKVSAWDGGVFNFNLYGDGLGNRDYVLFGTNLGTSHGIPLPGGLKLPLNWDWFTELLINLTISGSPLTNNFLGTLDADGYATAKLTVPGEWTLFYDLVLHFAWCTYNSVNFVSDPVEARILDKIAHAPFYQYDDGDSDNALGLIDGGELCWIHRFNAFFGSPRYITSVRTTFGKPHGNYPPAGTPAAVYIWDDPNNDGDPEDAVLLSEMATTVQDPGTDLFHEVDVGEAFVSGHFFIGAMSEHSAGEYPAPLDEDTPGHAGDAWIVGSTTYEFDPHDLSSNDFPLAEIGSIGFGNYWLLRAWGNYRD